MSDALARLGHPGRDGLRRRSTCSRDRPDLVVIGNAVRARQSRGARRRSTRASRTSRSRDALYQLAMRGPPLASCRGHARQDHDHEPRSASLLTRAGRDPSVLVGGVALDFDGSFREGEGRALRRRGRRVRHGLLRQDAEVPALPPAHAARSPRSSSTTPTSIATSSTSRTRSARWSREMPADGTIVAALDDADVRDVLRRRALQGDRLRRGRRRTTASARARPRSAGRRARASGSCATSTTSRRARRADARPSQRRERARRDRGRGGARRTRAGSGATRWPASAA